MLHYSYRFVILALLAFPIFYLLGGRFFPSFDNAWIIYFAIFCSGPLLLLYTFLLRLMINEKTFSSIALLIGGLWVGFELIVFIKNNLM